MTVIVTDTGFGADDWTGTIVPFDQITDSTEAVDLSSDTDPSELGEKIATLRTDPGGFSQFRRRARIYHSAAVAGCWGMMGACAPVAM